MRKLTLIVLIIATMTTLQSCKRKQAAETNPFFTQWETPFGVPPFDRIRAAHYKPAIEEGIARHLAEIDSIVNNPEAPSFENVIAALDRSGKLLTDATAVFFGVKAADSNDTLQQISLEVSPLISAYNDNITFNEKLFEKIRAVYDNRSNLGLDQQQMRLTEKTHKRFARTGALLSPEKKEELRKINEQLTTLSEKFGQNLLAENKNFALVIESENDLSGLPASVKSAAAAEAKERGLAGKWVFTTSKPSLLPFLTYSDRGDLREQLYNGYINRGRNGNEYDNREIASELAILRLQKANLLGFPTYAAYGLDNVMAKTPGNAYELLDKLWSPALKLAATELTEMRKIKLAETGSDDFRSSDWWFYAEKVRKAKYNLDEEMLRPYFSLENVRSGIFQLCNRLWGITFRPVVIPVYNKECLTYEVLDQDNSHLGILYLDFHPRPGKSGGAWCGTYRGQRYEDGERISPVVTIVCNFTRPGVSSPALLSLDETETFFHEFGHALHSLFSDVKFAGVRGVERDFVELPSQIMENWAFEPEVLRTYAKDFGTKAVINDALIAKIQNSSLFNQGFTTTELLAASFSDMDIHNITTTEPFDVVEFETKVLNEKRGLMPEIEPRYHYPYFSHIFSGGYSAGYYSYIWAEVLDKDAYETFVESGDIFNKKIAKSFRDTILSRGGIEDGMVMYERFRGRGPSVVPLMVGRGLMVSPSLEK